MIDIFNYGFIIRGLGAGVVIGIIAPLIGVFLVLRRYSQIADTISHVSLAGIAIGLLLKVNPMITAIITTVLSSVAIERLRISKKFQEIQLYLSFIWKPCYRNNSNKSYAQC